MDPRIPTEHRSRATGIALLVSAFLLLGALPAIALAQSSGIGARISGVHGAQVLLTDGAARAVEGSRGSVAGSAGSVGSVHVALTPGSGEVVGRARAENVALLGGRITIGVISVDAIARSDGTGEITGFTASGVTVDGVAVQAPLGGSIEIAGAGVLVFGEQVTTGGGLRVNGARLEISDTAAGVPLGTAAVIGHLDLSAAADPVPAPLPEAEPEPRDEGAERSIGSPDRSRESLPTATATRSSSGGTGDGSYSSSAPLSSGLGLPVRPAPNSTALIGADGYAFPVLQDYGYIDDYAAPRAGTGWHHGIDIFAPTGTPLVAVADGVLSKVGVNTLGGNRLWLTDDTGNEFYYAHLSAYAAGVTNGSRVSAGQIIGFVGNSGQAITTPPHLHFEIHPGGGDSINPYPYLLAWERGSDVARAFQAATVARGQVPASGVLLIDVIPDREVLPADDTGVARAVG